MLNTGMVMISHLKNVLFTQKYYFSGLEQSVQFLCKSLFKPENFHSEAAAASHSCGLTDPLYLNEH